MIHLSAVLEGLTEILHWFTAADARVQKTSRAAVRQAADDILKDAQDNYVPVRTGRLRASGYSRVRGSFGVYEIEVGFMAPYALTVHEAPDNWGQGKNKYLERPFLAALPRIEGQVYTAVLGSL